jgi:hypothetical protein
MAAAILQPFTAYLPPCLESLYREGATFGRADTKHCLSCIALYYQIQARRADPPIEDEGYSLIPMLQYINNLSHEKLTDEEIELIAEDVRSTSRSKITCREFEKSETLKALCVPEDCKLSDGTNDADPAAKKAADIIMGRGNVLKFLVRQAQKNHLGDEDILKHLLASIACTNSLKSAGIQPELNGEKGHGKTDAVRAVFHLIPDKWKLAASVSAKSLYYHKGLMPGSIIFSDDVQWSEDLISTVKRGMGSFQEPQTHFTLDVNRNPLPHTMPPRLVWWLSSVESVANDQLKDRQYSLDIDEGTDHARDVSDFLRCSRSQKKVCFSVDRGIEVARAIISQIKEHEPFKVVIDCAAVADWKVIGDHRTQNKFWDLVEAFAILRFKQRYIDEDGWLHASVEDFEEAKAIFMRRKANHRTGLTNAQTKIVKSVITLQNEQDGATQARIAEDLGVSQQAASKGLKAIMANTRFIVSYPGVHGETYYKSTVSGLEVVYGEGDIVTLPEGYNDLQPPYNHDTTNLTTIKTTNNNNKHTSIQPIIGECSKLVSSEGEVVSQPYHARKNGCKVVKSSLDNDSPSCKEVVSQVDTTILRFLRPVSTFVGLDMKTYGPFKPDDVATVPAIHAKNLIRSGHALEIHPGIGHHPRR